MSPYVDEETVGIVPAAGLGTRLGLLPCSKEILPLGLASSAGPHETSPKVACQVLLDQMVQAGVRRIYIVLREGKWDIPAYLKDGHEVCNADLAYLIMRFAHGAPFSVDQAFAFVKNQRVVFGFPDILFKADRAFEQIMDQHKESNVDVVLGLFPAEQPEHVDMVELSPQGEVLDLVIKPKTTTLTYTWAIATWSPTFTSYLHQYVGMRCEEPQSGVSITWGTYFVQPYGMGSELKLW